MSGFTVTKKKPRYDLEKDFPAAKIQKWSNKAPPLPLLLRLANEGRKKQKRGNDEGFDMIKEILVRVPVKSLLPCKAVCKSWCSLIESSAFIRHRITFKHSSSSGSSFIVLAAAASINECPKNTFLMLSPPDSVSKSKSPPDSESKSKSDDYSTVQEEEEEEDKDDQFQLECSEIKVENLGFPSDCKSSSSIEIVGSCNGLVCLYDRIDNHVYLWNPSSIREEFKILPKPINIVDKEKVLSFPPSHLVAFGFDVETKDYKVLLLSAYLDLNREDHKPILGQVKCLCRIQVYNLSTDSWRLIEGLHSLPGDPFVYYPTTEVLYLNGSCFFLAHFFHTKQLPRMPENDRFIISFDFTKEIITPIQLPDHHEDQMLYLRCWGDKMALFTVCPNPTPRGDSYYSAGILFADLWYDDFYCLPPPLETGYPELYRPPQGAYECMIQGSEDCNIWVLLDEQFSSNSSSWTKLHSFEIEHKPGQRIVPSCILNDGEFALLESRDSNDGYVHEMKLYNLVTEELENDFLSCCRFMSKAIAYKPGLVKLTASSSSSSSS